MTLDDTPNAVILSGAAVREANGSAVEGPHVCVLTPPAWPGIFVDEEAAPENACRAHVLVQVRTGSFDSAYASLREA